MTYLKSLKKILKNHMQHNRKQVRMLYFEAILLIKQYS